MPDETQSRTRRDDSREVRGVERFLDERGRRIWAATESRAWKHGLQEFADETRLRVHVGHFPPGTSKWNRIGHRLFCHITQNWRGKPLRTFETVVDQIGSTRTTAGLRVEAKLDEGESPTGEAVADAQMDALSPHRSEFHGDWNHELRPR